MLLILAAPRSFTAAVQIAKATVEKKKKRSTLTLQKEVNLKGSHSHVAGRVALSCFKKEALNMTRPFATVASPTQQRGSTRTEKALK